MAPLYEAVRVTSTSFEGKAVLKDYSGNPKLYTAEVDTEWAIGSVPNGGYILALILEACLNYQAPKSHIDPIHVTAHYLRAATNAPMEIYVRTLRSGKAWTNLTADLVQEGTTRVLTHVIFGTNAPSPEDKVRLTLDLPSPYARRMPLYSHPCNAIPKRIRETWRFHQCVKIAEDREIIAKNNIDSPHRTNSNTIGEGGLEWGAWFEFVDKGESISNPSLVFLVDICLNTPTLLPRSEKLGLGLSWFPTMTLAVEFKHPIPPPSTSHADRTVALYSLGRFLNHPQGRHDEYVEVWTAPSNIGEGEPVEGWRDKQICLAVATQMALTVPMEVNNKKGQKDATKL